jgi:hypothetical protein
MEIYEKARRNHRISAHKKSISTSRLKVWGEYAEYHFLAISIVKTKFMFPREMSKTEPTRILPILMLYWHQIADIKISEDFKGTDV